MSKQLFIGIGVGVALTILLTVVATNLFDNGETTVRNSDNFKFLAQVSLEETPQQEAPVAVEEKSTVPKQAETIETPAPSPLPEIKKADAPADPAQNPTPPPTSPATVVSQNPPPTPPAQIYPPPAGSTTSSPPQNSSPPAGSPPPPMQPVPIFISEVRMGTEASADDEFIELYNPNAVEVDLTGFSIKKKSSTGTESSLVSETRLNGKKIPALKHFLIGREGKYAGSVSVDATWATSYSLAYVNNAVILYDASGMRVSEVTWTEIEKGQSYECAFSGSCAIQIAPSPQNSQN